MSTPTRHLSATARNFVQSLSSTPRGARLGRLLVGEQLHAWSVPRDQAERAEHVVAELAANAALHGHHAQRDFRLALTFHPLSGALRVEVTDTRSEHPLPEQPSPPHPDRESGRGLLLVDALADRWGTEPHPPTGKTVWAELHHRRKTT